jgi:pimeloyl-ACP methyl ester carboxylesterase
MLLVRKYGHSGPLVIVLHGGPGAPGHMAPVARGLADLYRVLEPFQRASGDEPLTVAKHIADLHELIQLHVRDSPPALLGSSWGAMLALAYAATHPDSAGPLILVGCGTFDLVARARMQETIRLRLKHQIREDERFVRLYCYDPFPGPSEEEKLDPGAQQETWNDMLRLQAEGVYPAAFRAIRVPVLMLHGAFDPHPGKLIHAGLQPFVPQIEYHEWEHCGHYPWLEKATADKFFSFVREWLGRHTAGNRPWAPLTD